MVVASTYTDVLEGLEGISRIKRPNGNCQFGAGECSARVRQGCAKPSSSILYGIIRKNTDLKREDGKSAKQCKKTDGLSCAAV
jgi:hypothetical protein